MSWKEHWINEAHLPLVIEAAQSMKMEEFIQMIKTHQDVFKKHLLKCGGLLFRGFPVSNENDFAALIEALGTGSFIDYIGGDSPRNKVREGVYTSTEAPPSVKIPLHNELSFVNKYPKHIYFYCHIAPQEKGETIIGDARKIYQEIDSSVKERFIKKGLKYVSCYFYKSDFMRIIAQNAHKSWIDVFETHDKKKVEKLCKENDFELKWTKNDWMRLSHKRPATIKHPITQEDIWFNQAHLYDLNPKFLGWWKYIGVKLVYSRPHTKLHEIFFGDETPIPREDLYHVMDVLDANTIAFPWKRGDVMVLDNVLAMHGRATFSGKRRILTAMTG